MNNPKVGIVGQGYVGLTLAKHAFNHFEVTGFDVSEEVVSNLNRGISHIEYVSSSELLSALDEGKYRATNVMSEISLQDIIILAVPTPLSHSKKPDLEILIRAAETVGYYVKPGSLIINESTSFPGTLRNLIVPSITSQTAHGGSLHFAASPERVDPGRRDFTPLNTPRLIGGLTEIAYEKAEDFYGTFCSQLIRTNSPEIAEAAKIFENTFRQVNIGLVNEFSLICSGLNLDVHEILGAAGTKPFGFMKFTPGPGVGGHCIPVDPLYLKEVANNLGIQTRFIDLANEINQSMPLRIVEKIEALTEIKDKKILVIGVAYKRDISDTRETPAKELIRILREKSCHVDWHDDLVKQWENEESSQLGDYDIYIVHTLHSYLDLSKLKTLNKFIFDCTGNIDGAHKL